MANISSAHGTLTLVGNWSDRAVELFHPVLKSWEFYGAFGMSAYRMPTSNRPSAGFSGSGRWSFSGTLESFDDWTRDWIKDSPGIRHPLTQEQYDALLQVMAQDDLSIRMEFNDKGEEGYDLDEVGVFTSDGESLNYETLSCQKAEHSWTEVSREYFDGAVLYFQRLAPDADPNQIKKWVKVNIGPSSLFYGGTACLGDLYAEGAENTFDEERFQDFCATFSPKGEAWDAFVEECSSEFDWNIAPENHPAEPKIPFWVEHEELRRWYGWRDEFFWDVPTWKDVKRAAVGRDYVIRLKTDGTAFCAGGRYIPDLSVGLNVKGNMAHNGSNGKLEPSMTLAAMDHAGEAHFFSSNELEYSDGTDTSIRGMIFRLSPDGTWRRVANNFDPADYGQLAEQVARLEEQFGGRFKFDEIFAAADDEDDSREDEPAGYRDFLKGAMELLLNMELRLETTALENSELPHFLDEEGNEYFFGFTVFVINIGLSLGDVHTEAGEAVELTEEQRGEILSVLMDALQGSESPDWTEADEAWYQALKSDNEDAGYGGGDQDREYELGPVCIPLGSEEPVKVRGSRFVLAGRFSLCGDEAKITHMIEFMKGRCTDRVTKMTDYVVLGREGGLNWSDWENYVKAREQIEQGSGLRLIREEELTSALGDDLWETAKETYQEKPESP